MDKIKEFIDTINKNIDYKKFVAYRSRRLLYYSDFEFIALNLHWIKATNINVKFRLSFISTDYSEFLESQEKLRMDL